MAQVEDDKNISMTNVKIFTDSLKEAKITHFDYSGWEDRFNQALSGVDTQANTVMFNRNRLKMEIKQLMEEAESSGMSESDPGYNVALKLNAIMPFFGEELELRAVERELQTLMLETASNIINTMKGMGIAENVVKEQKEFLNEHWERLEKLFTDNLQSLATNNKNQIDVTLKHSDDINNRLIQQIEKREKFIEDMVRTKSVYEPTYKLSPPVQKVMDNVVIEKPVDDTKTENQKLLEKLDKAHDEIERIKKEQVEQQPVSELNEIKQAVISPSKPGEGSTIEMKEENDVNGTKLSDKEREKMSVPFGNVDSHSEIGVKTNTQEEEIKQPVKEQETIFSEIPTTRGLKISYAKKCKTTPEGESREALDKAYKQRMDELERQENQAQASRVMVDNKIPQDL